MSHSIYTGSFAALEIRWMEAISELQRDDPLIEIHVLIGSNILASYLKRRFAQCGWMAANIHFHTFLDLVRRLVTPSENAQQKPRLPKLGASILLENALAESPSPVYESLSGYRGFRDALLDTFRDLRDGGFSPEALERAIRSGNRTPDRLQHLLALAHLYRKFRERVSLFHDVDDDFRAAIRTLESSPVPGFSRLLVYGIYDATGQQSRLLGALKNSCEMVYFIPFVDEATGDFAQPFLKTRMDELGVDCVRLQPPSPTNSLEHLAVRGFGFSSESEYKEGLKADGSFALVSAPGESRAAVEVVREIFSAIRDGTISGFHEAAVILRQPQSDAPILAEVLRLRGVPCFVHEGLRFADRLLGRAIVALSDLESNEFSREGVLTAFELVAASLPQSIAASWDVQSWRALTNNPTFLGGVGSWDAGTSTLVEQACRELERAEAYPADIVEEQSGAETHSLQAARIRLESVQLLRDAWQLLRQACADWPAKLSWRDWAHFLEQRFERILGSSDDWPFFSTVLDEIGNLQALCELEIRDSRFEKASEVTRDVLRSALAESLSSLSYPMGRFQRSGVNLLPTSAARGLRFPLVIIPGLDEGCFPAKLRQDPLLLDSERLWIGNLPIKSKRMDEEKLLFDMAARSAQKRLAIMTSRLDESSDRERIPSQFFLRVAAAARGGVVSMRDLAEGTIPGFRSVSLDSPAPALDQIPVDEGEIRLRMITVERDTAKSALEALAQLEPIRLERPLAYDRARWTNKLTGFDGLLSDPLQVQWTAKRIGASAGPVSASRIEEYAKCPYFFFLKRVMELEGWEEQERVEGMTPLDRGIAVHSILEDFLKDLPGEMAHANSKKKLLSSLELQARDALEKSRPVGMPDLLWEIERDGLIAMLRNWLVFEVERADEQMEICRLEQAFGAFGPKSEHPGYRLQTGGHTFDFRGRIDRIDLSQDGKRARVIDYKTGTLPESMARKARTPLMSGERIQIVIYRGALSVIAGFEKVEAIEGEYLYLQPKDGRILPCSFTSAELQQASAALPAILEILGDGIEKGVFFARTRGVIRPYGHCEFCDYLPVCGKDRVQREERKANDPAVRKFLQILETLQ